jgi:hypothetical protein
MNVTTTTSRERRIGVEGRAAGRSDQAVVVALTILCTALAIFDLLLLAGHVG